MRRFRLLAHGSHLRDNPHLSLPNTRVSRGNSAICAHGFKTRGLRGQRSMEQHFELVLFRHSKLFLVWREYYLLLQGTYPLYDLLFVLLTPLDCSMSSLQTRTSSRSPQTIGSLVLHSTQSVSWASSCR